MNKLLPVALLIFILPISIWLVHEPGKPGASYYPPYDLMAENTPGDSIGSVTLNWHSLAAEGLKAPENSFYDIYRSSSESGPFTKFDSTVFADSLPEIMNRQYRDLTAQIGADYYYRVSVVADGKLIESNIAGPVSVGPQAVSGTVTNIPAEVLFPPSQLRAFDSPNDDGGSITLEWKISPFDTPKKAGFKGYKIFRADNPNGPFEQVADATGGESDSDRHVKILSDGSDVKNGAPYYYYVQTEWDGQAAKSNIAGPVKASSQWFHTGRGVSLMLLGVLVASILFFINQAKSGKDLFIRKIAGLEAVDEAVGRATEMGKKIFYIPGTQDMDNVQTIAGLTILSRVARLTAEYETKLEVPVSRSLVMVTAREIVKESYLNAGRPDFYNDDMVYYLTDDQFGYAAGIDGLVVRQRPATIFYQGAFYAESLVLAETGNSIGAIQIAGTAMPAQLPFFVAACDYTLIGEELFAASAYLSREPKLLGSLKGQDIGGKLVFLSLSIIFIIVVTVAVYTKPSIVAEVSRMFTVH